MYNTASCAHRAIRLALWGVLLILINMFIYFIIIVVFMIFIQSFYTLTLSDGLFNYMENEWEILFSPRGSECKA